MKIITFIRRHLAIVIALAVAIVMLVGIIVLMNVMTGSNQGATPDEATTVQPTTVAPTTAQPTTAQPTTVAPTTVAPTTEAEEEDDDAFYGGVGGGDTYVDPGDNSDMNGSKDSSSHDVDNEGRKITYGGNEGYGASTSSKKASPVPEEQFEERHPLPDPVNPQKDFPDSKTITYEDIQNGKEPEEGDIISLTPAN